MTYSGITDLCVVSYAAPGGLSAAPHAAPYRPSGPQHLTPLASWQVLRRPTRPLVLEHFPLMLIHNLRVARN